jgi:hypothetical protein
VEFSTERLHNIVLPRAVAHEGTHYWRFMNLKLAHMYVADIQNSSYAATQFDLHFEFTLPVVWLLQLSSDRWKMLESKLYSQQPPPPTNRRHLQRIARLSPKSFYL